MGRNLSLDVIRKWMKDNNKEGLYPNLKKEMSKYKNCAIEFKILCLLTRDNIRDIKVTHLWHLDIKKRCEHYIETLNELLEDKLFQTNATVKKNLPPILETIHQTYDWYRPIIKDLEKGWNNVRKRTKRKGQKSDPYKITILWSLVEYWLIRGCKHKEAIVNAAKLLHPKYGFPFSPKAIENNWRKHKKITSSLSS